MRKLKKALIRIIDWFVVHIPRIPTAIVVAAARLLPLRSDILLESKPTFSDNTDAVYRELLRRGYNRKYRLIWITHVPYDGAPLPENVQVLNLSRSRWDNLVRGRWIIARAKYIIDCNGYVRKTNRRTVRVHLKHGLAIKSVPEYSHMIGDVDLLVVPNDYWIDKSAKEHLVDPAIVKPLGFPRNDVLLRPKKPHEQTNIIWMPTYRMAPHQAQQFPLEAQMYAQKMPFGFPCIRSREDFEELNAMLSANNAVLYLRLHPAQDTSQIRLDALSNVRICDDTYLRRTGTQLYTFLTQTDALISDYSSIYYDYLLLDKPIALSVADFAEYSRITGLTIESPEEYKAAFPAVYLYTFDDLKEFLRQVIAGEDPMREARNAAREKYMGAQTDHAAATIVDYLETHFRLGGADQ